jgi:outer membrane immunogenic protein
MSNRKFRFLAHVAAVGAMMQAGAVLAADMPTKARPLTAAYYDWSGVYAGVHVGYGGGMTDWNDQGFDFASRGFLGGGQFGINKQIASLVFGLEVDGSWANLNGSQSIALGGPVINNFGTGTATSKIDGLLTFAGRAGLAADRWFVYAKGGLALAHETHSVGFSGTTFVAPVTTASFAASASENRWGAMLGFGAEYALGGNWSVKAEYDYMNFGSHAATIRGSQTSGGITSPVVGDTGIQQDAIHLAKLGVNYRFGGVQTDPTFAPVPAAAGYNWSGGYIGVQAGYGFGHQAWPDFAPQGGSFGANGWLAGGTVGANAQAGKFVFGVEGEWMGTGIKGTDHSTLDFGGGDLQHNSLGSQTDWLAIASARAGFVVGDRLLIYGKGGVALAEEKYTYDVFEVANIGSLTGSLSGKAVRTGVVAGAGAEYALGGNWSAKIEYDYIKMSAQNITTNGTYFYNAPPTVGSLAYTQRIGGMTESMNLVKAGVNYHFSPVAASARD